MMCKGKQLHLACDQLEERLVIMSSSFVSAATSPIYCYLDHRNFPVNAYPEKNYFQDPEKLSDIRRCEKTPVTQAIVKVCHGQKACNVTVDAQQIGAKDCKDLNVLERRS